VRQRALEIILTIRRLARPQPSTETSDPLGVEDRTVLEAGHEARELTADLFEDLRVAAADGGAGTLEDDSGIKKLADRWTEGGRIRVLRVR
jgi:hypothetical protein